MAELYHYGTKRHSGRYPYGSGENPYQHETSFQKTVRELKEQGMTNTEIARYLGMSTKEFRERVSIDKDAQNAANRAEILRLKEKGWSNTAIAERIGKSEGYVRQYLQPVEEGREQITNNVADVLKTQVANSNYIDVGAGSSQLLGVSQQKLDTAVRKLIDEEGYAYYNIYVPQLAGNSEGKFTTLKVLAAPGVTKEEIQAHKDEIGLVTDFHSIDGGRSFLGIKDPISVDSNRIQIIFAEQGGTEKDGVVELRRGVEDLSLGNANYAQVRIAVDGTHYIKGMAMYADDLPPGVDIRFNTNKHEGTPIMGPKDNTVLKPLKGDPDNPFGSLLKIKDGIVVGQRNYIDKDGNEKLSPINIVREEGDWNTWSKSLASQFLSKQPMPLIKQQLNLSYSDKEAEYKKIMEVTNPDVRKRLLKEFADECDSAAVHLKAAALPRQSSKVILPLQDLKDNEVYAPTYRDGEQVALVRYPHGGTFEIPILTVRNKGNSGDKLIGKNAIDAIGINSKVAGRLSGADFDGDSVLVIPTIGQKIKATSALKGLEGFEPKELYPYHKGMKLMKNTQTEMGKVSNLITDMTLKGAPDSDIAKAVRHSMVVIDAEKHRLDYKQSEIDNDIAALKEKYQGGKNKGASTLISQAKSRHYISNRDPNYKIDPDTGKKIWEYTPKFKTEKKVDKKTGEINYIQKEVPKRSTKMYETEDAFTLSSGTKQEEAYASYANKLKLLGNQARKDYISTPSTKYSESARKTYSKEVDSLNVKLNDALKNKPYERKAQVLANIIFKSKLADNPAMDSDDIKKVKTQSLTEARSRTGASKKDSSIKITPSEWEAINAGALRPTKLSIIFDNTDSALIKQYATPKERSAPSTSEINRMQSLSKAGYTLSEIADHVGYSTTTVYEYLNEGRE